MKKIYQKRRRVVDTSKMKAAQNRPEVREKKRISSLIAQNKPEAKTKQRLAWLNGTIFPYSGAKGKHWKVKDTSKVRVSHKGINKGRPSPMKGKRHTEKTKKKMSAWHINHPNKKFSNTLIEQKVAKELDERSICYQQNIGLCNIANVDFYLPEYRIVIECDGDYYHTLPGAKENDEKKTNLLRFNGFSIYRFWEHEINESVKKCLDKINLF